MYQQILVAVDGSEVSTLALQEAIRLAQALHARLELVHVVDTVNLNLDSEFGDLSAATEAAGRAGQTLLTRAAQAAHGAGVEAQTRLLSIETLGHRTPDTIAAEAERWPADLIVLGTHGRRGVHHLLVGSVAEGVVRVATKPVLLIRGAAAGH